MSRDEKSIMHHYLTKNNYEKYNDYIKGYYSAVNLADDAGVKRGIFYIIAESIDPDVIEKRKQKRNEKLKYIERAIKHVIPYEYMEFDQLGLFGYERYSKNRTVSKDKTDVAVMLKQNKNDLDGFKFIVQSKMVAWYKNYLVSNEIKHLDETGKTLSEIARQNDMKTKKIYAFRDFVYENNGRFLKGVSEEQEKVFIHNCEMYKEYKETEITEEKLAEKYSIPTIYLTPLINAYKDAEEKIFINK